MLVKNGGANNIFLTYKAVGVLKTAIQVHYGVEISNIKYAGVDVGASYAGVVFPTLAHRAGF